MIYSTESIVGRMGKRLLGNKQELVCLTLRGSGMLLSRKAIAVAVVSSFLATCGGACAQEWNPVRCEIGDGGKTIRILASNRGRGPLVCTKVRCESTPTASGMRICEIEATRTVQPGESNVEIGSCSDASLLAKAPLSESHSCN